MAYDAVTGHNVPRVFHDFIARGPIDGLFAFGHPITDPYWVRARVGGVERDVLVQLYERRVLTYNPANPAGHQVEMGNVGQHYFQWRYPHLGQPWHPGADFSQDVPVAYASPIGSDPWQVYLLGQDGVAGPQITAGREETLPSSWRRSYLGGTDLRLLMASRRDGGSRRLFSMGRRGVRGGEWQHNPAGDLDWHYFHGAVSPDGALIAMAVEQSATGFYTIGFQPLDQIKVLPEYAQSLDPTCRYESPSWLPDGSGLVFAANCGGRFAIYRADLRYLGGDLDWNLDLDLVNVRPIAATPDADNFFPRVSPDGTRVVFASNRGGQSDLYLVDSDGRGEWHLTWDASDEGMAAWSPDGTQLVFESNRDGDYELYQIDIRSPVPFIQLTSNTVDDRWPTWF